MKTGLQGVPFYAAGDELLRSKSLDRDSYNSGDWFNRLDWTGDTHNFGVGLPVATKNAPAWDVMRPLLANPALKPTKYADQIRSDQISKPFSCFLLGYVQMAWDTAVGLEGPLSGMRWMTPLLANPALKPTK